MCLPVMIESCPVSWETQLDQSIPQDIAVACLALLYALLVSSSFDFAMGQLLVLFRTMMYCAGQCYSVFLDFEWM